MLIELHAIQNHAPSNLNRDDTGSPKEAFFGGYRRARISSQCLKRSIRKSPLFRKAIGDEVAFRTKRLAEKVVETLKNEMECDDEKARRIGHRAAVLGSGEKQDREADDEAKAKETPEAADKPTKANKKTPKKQESQNADLALPSTKQLIFLGQDEVREIAAILRKLENDMGAEAFAKMKAGDLESAISKEIRDRPGGARPIPVEIALFGRMTTSDAFEDVHASVQVAHALATNKLDHEFDYYTAVDDLKDASAGDDMGAGMLGDVEFNSSCFYKYFSIDWPALVAKVGDVEVAKQGLRGLIEAALLTTPTGKQNSFAAHNPPDFVLVEVKPRTVPLSYANAFVRPAGPHGRFDLVEDSIAKLAHYITHVGETYGVASQRYWITTRQIAVPATTENGGAKKEDGVQVPGKKLANLEALIEATLIACTTTEANP